MKRSKRMTPVRKLKQQEERTAAKKFAGAQQEAQRELQQLQMLEKYQQDYFSSLHDNQGRAAGHSLSAQQLDKYQMFLARLHKAIENQRQVLVIKEKGVEAARKEWAEANARLKALDSLIEKMVIEEEQMKDKQEQRLIDDLPLRNNHYK